MTAYSKSAKRRAKQGKRSLFAAMCKDSDFAPEPVKAEDPQKTAKEARARKMGQSPTKGHLDPVAGEFAGRALLIGAKDRDEAKSLWQTFREYDAAMETYSRRIIGASRHPNVSKMEFLPETFEARDDDAPDLRSDDEKTRDAINRHADWMARMDKLYPWQRAIIDSVSRGNERLHDGPDLTTAGRSFVAAMRRLHEVS